MARQMIPTPSDAAARKQRHTVLVEASRARVRRGTPEDAQFEPVPTNRAMPHNIHVGQKCDRHRASTISTEVQSAYRTLRSKWVPLDIQEDRSAICNQCPFASRIQRDHQIDVYCGCCGCGHWSALGMSSTVVDKNMLADHECPHDPPYFERYTGNVNSQHFPWWRVAGAMAVAGWHYLKTQLENQNTVR